MVNIMINSINSEIKGILKDRGIEFNEFDFQHGKIELKNYIEQDGSIVFLYLNKAIQLSEFSFYFYNINTLIEDNNPDFFLIFVTPNGAEDFVDFCENSNFGIPVETFIVGFEENLSYSNKQNDEIDKLDDFSNKESHEIIDLLKDQLIDLSRRNKLLNYTPSRDSIRIVKETPNDLHNILVTKQKNMTLEPFWDLIDDDKKKKNKTPADIITPVGTKIEDIDHTLDSSKEQKPEHIDDLIQTAHSPKKLQSIAGKTYTNARRVMKITGTNQLYLAIGFLKWYERPDSDIESQAPLILIPIVMERTRKIIAEPILPNDEDFDPNHPLKKRRVPRFVYTVKYTGEEIVPNSALKLLMDQNFDLAFPEKKISDFTEIEETPEDYLELVSKWASGYHSDKRWQVKIQAAIGFFDFAQAWMYEDLIDKTWKKKDCSAVSIIFGGGYSPKNLEPLDNKKIEKSEGSYSLPLVCPADTSQYQVIMRSLGKNSLVIEGPPGTGKSQTIANIISSLIDRGDKILFLAAKERALSVVSKRLEEVGLGQFLLSMHADGKSAGSNTIEISENIARTNIMALNQSQISMDKVMKIQMPADQNRKKLNEAATHLSAVDVTTGMNLSQMLWEANTLSEHMLTKSKKLGYETDFLPVNDALNKYGLYGAIHEAKDFILYLQDLEDDGDLNPNPEWKGIVVDNLDKQAGEKILNQAEIILNNWTEIEKSSFPLIIPSENLTTNIYLELHNCINEADIQNWDLGIIGSENEILKNLSEAQQSIEDLFSIINQYHNLTKALNINPEHLPDAELIKNIISSRENLIRNHPSWRNTGNQTFLESLRQQLLKIKDVVQEIKKETNIVNSIPANDINLISVANMQKWLTLISEVGHKDSINWEILTPKLVNPEVNKIIEKLQLKINSIKQERIFLESIIDFNCLPDETKILEHKKKLRNQSWWSRYFGEHKKAFKETKGYFHKPVKTGNDVLNYLNKYHELITNENKIDNHEEAISIFGKLYRGLDTDWEIIKKAIDHVKTIVDIGGIQRLPSVLNGKAPHVSSNLLEAASMALDELSILINEHIQLADYKLTNLSAMRWGELTNSLSTAIEDINAIVVWYDTIPIDPLRLIPFGQIGGNLDISKELRILMDLLPQHKSRGILGSIFKGISTSKNQADQVSKAISTIAVLTNNSTLCESITYILQNHSWKDIFSRLKKWYNQNLNYVSAICNSEKILNNYCSINDNDPFSPSKCKISLLQWKKTFNERLKNPKGLYQWQELLDRLKKGDALGFSPLIHSVLTGDLPIKFLLTAYKASAYRTYSENFCKKNDIDIKNLLERHIARRREEFQKADKKRLSIIPEQIISKLSKINIPNEGKSGAKIRDKYGMDLIRNAIGKKRTSITVRDLMQRSFKTLQAYKPCWLMSPGSTSQYLPRENDLFDVLIIDEASQLRTSEVAAAALRCKRMLIFGDTKQMPPNVLGRRIAKNENDDYVTGESVLERAAMSLPTLRLEWHYRSQHEDLIKYSNYHFYNNNLVIFPTRTPGAENLGITYKYVGGYFVGRRNLIEAEEATKALCEHVLAEYKKIISHRYTVGIVTMNADQRDLITEFIDLARTENSKLDKALKDSENSEEPYFVTNLENVQGDERDHIIISCTYGPEDKGLKPRNNFGPINISGGERRLNVLYTRSRRQMTILSSIHSHEITSLSDGAKHFRGFLEYARTGKIIDQGNKETGDAENEFEETVGKVLNEAGYKISYQVGVKGYRIDIAVHDPDIPGHYIMAIECDGASFHSSKTARERDRLRQEILENAGWLFYRVWSTDWFLDRDKTVRRLIDAVSNRIEEIKDEKKKIEDEAIKQNKKYENIDDTEIENNDYEENDQEENSNIIPINIQENEDYIAEQVDEELDEPLEAIENYTQKKEIHEKFNENDLKLHSYEEYIGPVCIDPRNAEIENIAKGLENIIMVEGPVLVKRTYDIYLRSCGIKRMGKDLKSILNKTLQYLISKNIIILDIEDDSGGFLNNIVRNLSQDEVILRERGPRSFEEIPRNEILKLIERLLGDNSDLINNKEDLMRSILEMYDLLRLTTKVKERLENILEAFTNKQDVDDSQMKIWLN